MIRDEVRAIPVKAHRTVARPGPCLDAEAPFGVSTDGSAVQLPIVSVTEHRAAIASHFRDDDGAGDRASAIRVDHLAVEFGAFRDCRERRSDGKCENKRDVRPAFPVRHGIIVLARGAVCAAHA